MSQAFRAPEGGLIDRARPLRFSFDGERFDGYAGDTLAAALLANGLRLVGRSFKYHRPRGIYAAGIEEPSALVTLGEGARATPNTPATVVDLEDGLVARSQNRWPSLRFDLMAVNGLLSPFFAAGFYYKTFMGPPVPWHVWEPIIRKAAGLGTAAREPDPDRYETLHDFADVLIVGAGPAGLAAARELSGKGLRVRVTDERARPGGDLLGRHESVEGQGADAWLADTLAALEGDEGVQVLRRATAFGLYDGLVAGIVERLDPTQGTGVRERLRIVRARQVILATGALERPLVFPNNDRPGVMLASAARAYANLYAVRAGERAVVATADDAAYWAAADLEAAGVEVVAICDLRSAPGQAARVVAEAAKIPVHAGCSVTGADARGTLQAALVHGPSADARIACDLLAAAGGWSPVVHLHSQRGVKPVWRADLAMFVPGADPAGIVSAGACLGYAGTTDCIASGRRAAEAARAALDGRPGPARVDPPEQVENRPLQSARMPKGGGKAFIDLQNDVTAADVGLAAREGYDSVELMKRYTTLSMATDQGKTSNVNGLAVLAEAAGRSIPEIGTTTFRPPYAPVSIGVLAGPHVGAHFRPLRRTPLHDWHAENGADFVEAGLWLRARAYPEPGEDLEAALRREAAHVRAKVGMVDVSTLGKIDVQGPDAAEFLNRVYVNGWSKLAVGKARYGVMLRPDGMVFDDGTTARLAEDRFFMTTTTAQAGPVMSYLEFLLETAWPELRVNLVSITDQWAGIALAGPRARDVLAALLKGHDVSNEALPFMGVMDAEVEGIPVRVHRISFSGELAYELFVPSGYARPLWEALRMAGAPHGILPYGTEAMGALRIEKGHVAGPELDGRTTLADIGLVGMASRKKPFVGQVLARRPALADPARPRLVGLRSVSPQQRIRAGAILFDEGQAARGHGLGHVSSVTFSPALGGHIALGFLAEAERRKGRRVVAHSPVHGEATPLEVVDPVFVDPEGARVRA